MALINIFSIPEALDLIKPLALFVLGIVVYALFIFKFYRFIGKKNIFELDLHKYDTSKFGALKKAVSGILYIFEYIFLFPIFAFSWFLVLTVLLSVLSKHHAVENILLISIALVSAIRIAAYYNEDLSKDLAKMLPFALLGVFLVDMTFFSLDTTIATITQLPTMWKNMLYYLVFVIALEFILRISYAIASPFLEKK